MSPVLHPLQGTVFIWALVWIFCFFFASPVLLVTVLWQQNVFTCYFNLKPHFFLLNKYLFCSGSWGVLCWLRDQWQLHHGTPLPCLSGLWIDGKLLWLPLFLGVCCRQPHPGDSDTVHRLLSTIGCECPSCFTGVTGSLKLNNHSWGKIYWITNNPFFSSHSIYLLAVIMPKHISCLMKLCEKATTGAEWHLFTVHSLPVHC